MIRPAEEIIAQADIVLIIGTSLQVYPAAGLVQFAPRGSKKYYIDPNPDANIFLVNTEVLRDKAGIAVPALVEKLMSDSL